MLLKAAIRLEFTREKIVVRNAVQTRNALGYQYVVIATGICDIANNGRLLSQWAFIGTEQVVQCRVPSMSALAFCDPKFKDLVSAFWRTTIQFIWIAPLERS